MQTTSKEAPTKAGDKFLPLDIAVVGAGLGGLAAAYLLGRAGHRVTVFEAASTITDVGAGIQLSPNVTRLLARWGLGEKVKELAFVPQTLSLRRYKNGEVVGWRKWGEIMERDYGAPYCHIHRADIHNILFEHAKPYINFRPSSTVVSVDPSVPSLTLASGEIIRTQVVIGADGVHSRIRSILVGKPDSATPTGDAAYRTLIPTSLMLKDPELKELVNEGANCWMGPKRHVVGYCVRRKELYNLVLIHPCKGTNETTREVDCDVMRKDFEGFEPRVQKLLSLVDSALVWSLMDRKPLDSWVHKDSKVCLLGDACHPMLPYRAQGAAMAIEDAAVLGNLLSRVTQRNQVPALLQAYQDLRLPRATLAQDESRMNQLTFHLEDGPDQERRDNSMRAAMEVALKELRGEIADTTCVGSENMWGDKEKNDRSFGYDADVHVEKWWAENSGRVLAKAKL
ncbi:hypothetical protein NLJ89_g3560 [Agrocybe chaxingu]|uniref:FAD-binding domain-containing protein n=1 Tax=Agrocybe chaxingu TaxID=84603 RepID=A0A9W8MY95_9AGAR|nr:hypothetical protein NLJ89_g3560 [Agrocybe chaxingu]